MNLNTLHHGSFHILVTDIRCPKCRRYIPYDGFGDTIFCLNRTQEFTRELLDVWIMAICGSGGTFRDAFASWATKSTTVSAEIIHIGNPPTINRQRCNEAFTSFLMALRFLKSQDLCELFSCKNCEVTLPNGETRFDGVVMDGTTVGILGNLPSFQRDKRTLLPVGSVADHQYVIRSPKIRQIIDSVMVAAQHANGRQEFSVQLKPTLWKQRDEILPKVFGFSVEISHSM